ncbi:MAG TPA: Maf family protein [Anaerolineales bacterium]|nr:Maf family protein [Anaerolineales bacterium]
MLEFLPVAEKLWLVLASSSPRRRQLLSLASWPFSIAVADVDESQFENEVPADYVLRLAESKARTIASQTYDHQIILAADTTVVDGDDILGKPGNSAEAVQMLTRLRGHAHQVYTGIALLRLSDGLLLKDLCVTDVPMRAYSDEEIQAYVQTGDPLDKAGAYAIQHPHFHPVAEMHGCYASVMGLPMCHVVRLIRQMDISPNANVPVNCQLLLDYHCPVSRAILNGTMSENLKGKR